MCHSLGMGKSFGFGQVKISVSSTRFYTVNGENVNLENLIKTFSSHMDKVLGSAWIDTPQMQQLLGMADPEKAKGKILKHMTIGAKEFIEGKKRKERLEPYVRIAEIKNSPTDLPTRQPVSPPISDRATSSSSSDKTECWKNVQLTFDFDKMEYGIVGKNAATKHNAQKPLLSDRELFLIKSNRKRMVNATVKTNNGKTYQIVKLELC